MWQMNFKFGFNQIVSSIFVFLALIMLVMTVKIGSQAYQKYLAVDEKSLIGSGTVLQESSLNKAIEIIEKESNQEIKQQVTSNEQLSDQASGSAELKDNNVILLPKKIELIITTGVDKTLVREIKQILGEEIEIIEKVEEVEENQVIYKEAYGDLKNELVNRFKDTGKEIKVLKRKDDKEFDMTIKIS